MYIADMHCDSLSLVSEERGMINSYNFSNKNPTIQFFAHFSPKRDSTPEERRKRLVRAFNLYISECERLGLMRVKCAGDVLSATDSNAHAALFSIEGGAGLFADSPELPVLAGAGLAVLGMAWDSNELSASAYDESDTGLTDEGKKLLLCCAELGIIIDVSHMSDKAFFEAFEHSVAPHIATHSNFRELCPSRRNLTLDMARAIAKRGGVIGLNLYPPFLREGGVADGNDILRHVDYALEFLGDRCLGFGFDIDGTDGVYPKGISAESSIHDQVIELLLSHYSASTVERIAGLNVIEFLKNNLAGQYQ